MIFWSRLWTKWKALARRVAKIQTIIILTLFYFTLLGLYALILKLFRRDLLDKKWKKERSFWIEREKRPINLESAKRQF